jgi:hypothetical protein
VERFLARYRPLVTGVLCGFDRLVFRGSILSLIREGGMYTFLKRAGVRLLDFKDYVQAVSGRLEATSLLEAHALDRPIRYLRSSKTDKEELARQLLAEHPVEAGLICVLRVVEPCMSFEYHRSQDRGQRGLKLRPRKCLHLYKYYLHPRFGFMNARIETWFPFNVQICLNGREWLAHRLGQDGGCDFTRHDNCFAWLADPALAQRLADEQLTLAWPTALDAVAEQLNPLHRQIFEPWPQQYYWSAYQSEWATDVLFRDAASLAARYPALVKHAMLHFQSPDVMRFLGRKPHGNFTGQVVSSFKQRPEGVRVKHWVKGNSIKMYDKAGSVLRVETTVANTLDFKVLRPLHDEPESTLAWRPLRKGVADLHRRAQVSQRANERYLDALASVDDSTSVAELLDRVSRRTSYHGRRVRALRIGDPQDIALLAAISRGELTTAGFRNRDLRRLLHPTAERNLSAAQIRRLSARISRQLRLLRAHRIIRKLPNSHRYQLTAKGRLITAALFAARQASLKNLLAAAA